MKCLEKDRTRRYETANGLARDVERYLADEPVEAGPPSAGYRLRKFIRRHRGATAVTAGLLAFAVVVGRSGLAWGLFRATRAEGETSAALNVANELGADAEAEKNAKQAAKNAEIMSAPGRGGRRRDGGRFRRPGRPATGKTRHGPGQRAWRQLGRRPRN